MAFVWVALGGALGASLRYAIYKFCVSMLTSIDRGRILSADFSPIPSSESQGESHQVFNFLLWIKDFFQHDVPMLLGHYLGLPMLATLSANLIGAFLAGFVYWQLPDGAVRLFLLTGFLGGLTTMSSFNVELIQLALSNEWQKTLIYVCMTLAGGLGLAMLGFYLASLLSQPLK